MWVFDLASAIPYSHQLLSSPQAPLTILKPRCLVSKFARQFAYFQSQPRSESVLKQQSASETLVSNFWELKLLSEALFMEKTVWNLEAVLEMVMTMDLVSYFVAILSCCCVFFWGKIWIKQIKAVMNIKNIRASDYCLLQFSWN